MARDFFAELDQQAEEIEQRKQRELRRKVAGSRRLEQLPEKISEIVTGEFDTPGEILAKLPTVAGTAIGAGLGGPAGAALGAIGGSAVAGGIEELAAMAAREGYTKAPYEFLTGEEFLTKEEIARLPPEEARLTAQRQMPVYKAAGREFQDIATGIVALPAQIGRALTDEDAPSLGDLAGETLAGATESIARTISSGGLRREEPISSILDIASIAGVPAYAKGFSAGKGLRGRARTGREAAREFRGEMIDTVGAAIEKSPAGAIISGYKGVTPGLRPVIEEAGATRRGGIARATEPAQALERALAEAPTETADKVMRWFADVEASMPGRKEGIEASRKVRQLQRIAEDTPEILDQPWFQPVKEALDEGVTWNQLATDIDAVDIVGKILRATEDPELRGLERLGKKQAKLKAKLTAQEEELTAAQAKQAQIRQQVQQEKIASLDEQVQSLVPEDVLQSADKTSLATATKKFGEETGSERWVDYATEPKEAAVTQEAFKIRERSLQPQKVDAAGTKIKREYDKETQKAQNALRQAVKKANPFKTQEAKDSLLSAGMRDFEQGTFGDLGASELGPAARAANALRDLRKKHRAELDGYKKAKEEIPYSVTQRHRSEIAAATPTVEQKAAWTKFLEPLNKIAEKGAPTWDPILAWRRATKNLSDDPTQAAAQLERAADAVRDMKGSLENFQLPLDEYGFAEWKVAQRSLDEFNESRGLTAADAQRQYIKEIEQKIADVEAELRGNPLQLPKDVPSGEPIAAATRLRVTGAVEKGAAQANLKQLNKQLADLRRERKKAMRDLSKGRSAATQAQIRQGQVIGRRAGEVAATKRRMSAIERQRDTLIAKIKEQNKDFDSPAGVPPIKDVIERGVLKNVETEFLQRQGAMLVLDGAPLNTVESAIKRAGFGDNLLDAVKTGRLRFETAPGADPGLATFLNEGGTLQYLAAQAENAKELASYGRLGEDTLAANLTSYIAALYDEDVLLQQKRLIAEDKLQRDAARILSNVEDVQAASKALTKLIDEARSKISVGRGAMAGKPATLGPVDRGMFRRAIAKYNQDLDQQIIMGRHGPDKLPQLYAETLRRQEMALGEARVLRGAKRYSLSAAEIIGIETMPKRRVRFGSRLDGTQESIPTITYQNETWAQVPTTKIQGSDQARWGELAGRWMRLQDLKKLEGSVRMRASLLRRVTNAWKANKILGRFGGHVMQLIENMVKTSFMGGAQDVAKLPLTYRKLKKSVANPKAPESKMYVLARDAGVFEDDLLASGFPTLKMGTRTGPDFLEMMLDEIRRIGGEAKVLDPSLRGKLENLKTAAKGLSKPEARLLVQENIPEILTSIYELPTEYIINRNYKGFGLKKLWEAQDATFRFYAFETALQNKAKNISARTGESVKNVFERLTKDPEQIKQAAAESRQWGFDYSDLPKWAEIARSVPFVGVPFVAWPVKATGFYTRLGWQRPEQFKLLKEATDAQTALASDRERRTLQFAPPWAKRRAVLVSPEQILNTTFMSPVTYWPITENWVQGGTDQTNRGAFAGLGGALNSLYEVGVNYSTFLQRPIYQEDDTALQALAKSMNYLVAQEGPGVVGDILYKLTPALTGESELFRGRRLSPWEAVAHTFGIKAETVDLPRAVKASKDTFQKRIRNAKKWFKKLTPEERLDPDNRREFDQRMIRAYEEYAGKLTPYF